MKLLEKNIASVRENISERILGIIVRAYHSDEPALARFVPRYVGIEGPHEKHIGLGDKFQFYTMGGAKRSWPDFGTASCVMIPRSGNSITITYGEIEKIFPEESTYIFRFEPGNYLRELLASGVRPESRFIGARNEEPEISLSSKGGLQPSIRSQEVIDRIHSDPKNFLGRQGTK